MENSVDTLAGKIISPRRTNGGRTKGMVIGQIGTSALSICSFVRRMLPRLISCAREKVIPKRSPMTKKRIIRGLLTLPVRRIRKVKAPPSAATRSAIIKSSDVLAAPPTRKYNMRAVAAAAIKLVRSE